MKTKRTRSLVPRTALLLMVALPALMAGCRSIESSHVLGALEQDGRTTEDAGETKIFLELVSPDPNWHHRDRAQRESWSAAAYQDDVRRGFVTYEVPTAFRVDVNDFQFDPAQASRAAPLLVLQLKERRLVTVKKQHQVTRRGLFVRGSEVAVEQVPVWSHWRATESEQSAAAGEELIVSLPEEQDVPGIFWTVSGPVDDQGRLQVSLTPWLEQAARRGRDLKLQVRCPARNLTIDVAVSRNALLHYQGAGR